MKNYKKNLAMLCVKSFTITLLMLSTMASSECPPPPPRNCNDGSDCDHLCDLDAGEFGQCINHSCFCSDPLKAKEQLFPSEELIDESLPATEQELPEAEYEPNDEGLTTGAVTPGDL